MKRNEISGQGQGLNTNMKLLCWDIHKKWDLENKDGKDMRISRKSIGIFMALLMIGSCVTVPLGGAFGLGAHSRANSGADMKVVSVVRTSLGTPKVNGNITFEANITNVGDLNATNVTITIKAMNNTIAPIDLGTYYMGHDWGKPNITGKPTSTPYYLDFYWNTSKTGLGVKTLLIYTVEVTAHNYTDLNATNDTAHCNIQFSPADWKEPHVTNISATPKQEFVGQNITINATFMNNGSLPVQNEPVFFYLDYKIGQTNKVIYNTKVNITGIHDVGEVYVEFDWNTKGATLGNHTIRAVVQSTGSNYTTENITVSGKPDLTILALALNNTTVNITVLRGLPLNLSVTIKNIGNNTSKATLVNVTDTIGTYSASFSIPAMAAGALKVYYFLVNTSKLSIGMHTLQAWVDKLKKNDEWADSNNMKTITFSVTSLPDLAVFDLKFYQADSWVQIAQAHQGDIVKVTVNAKNLGLASSKNNTMLVFYLDNTTNPIKTMEPYSQGAGATSCSQKDGIAYLLPYVPGADYYPLCKWNTTTVSLGVHKIIAVMDPTKMNGDLNSSNNMVSINFTIIPVVRPPDLTIDSIQLSTTSIAAGDKVQISIVVDNKGLGPAGNIDLDARLETMDGTVVSTIEHRVIPFMDAGAKQFMKLFWNFSVPLALGNYKVSVFLDKDGKIKETDEANNELTATVKVIERVVLKSDPMIFSIVTAPAKPTEGKKVKVTVTLINKGNKDARDLRLILYLDKWKVGEQTLALLGKNGSKAPLVFNVTFNTTGKHDINTTLLEEDVIVYSGYSHKVDVQAPSSTFTTTNTILLILALLLLVAIAVVLLAGGKKKPSEYEDEEEEAEDEEEKPVADGDEEE